jgi:hypothetical protein
MVDVPTPPGGGTSTGGSSGSSGGSSSSGSSGSSSGSSSSSSSSGSSSASSGPSKAEIAAKRNAEISYKVMLQQLGIPMTKNMQRLIKKAVTQGWSSTTFQFNLRRTPDYHKQFPGNVNKDGTLRLTEAAYIARAAQYKDSAAMLGVKVSPKLVGTLIKKQISPQLFADRARAVKMLRTNKSLYEEFGQYLTERGIEKKPPNKKQLLKFSIGQGPGAWDREWDTAYAASQLESAGITVGRGQENDIHWKALQKDIKGADVENMDWETLAWAAHHALPASKLYGMGIKERDLITLAKGGPGAQVISDRVKQAFGTWETAVTEKTAQPQTTQGPAGTQVLTGRRPMQATE